MRIAGLCLIAIFGLAVLAAPTAAEVRPRFCEDAKQRITSNLLLREAVETVFGRVDDARYGADSQCVQPVEVLHYGAVDVLITNVTEGFCHACGGRFSAYALRRRKGHVRLVKAIVDFATGGSWGTPGELTPTRFAGDDALILTSVDSGGGNFEEQLSLFVFRGGRIVDLSGTKPIILSASNGGAVDESQVISVEGRWIVESANNNKLAIDYKVTKSGVIRREHVVWGLHDGRLRLEQGREPPELREAAGR